MVEISQVNKVQTHSDWSERELSNVSRIGSQPYILKRSRLCEWKVRSCWKKKKKKLITEEPDVRAMRWFNTLSHTTSTPRNIPQLVLNPCGFKARAHLHCKPTHVTLLPLVPLTIEIVTQLRGPDHRLSLSLSLTLWPALVGEGKTTRDSGVGVGVSVPDTKLAWEIRIPCI